MNILFPPPLHRIDSASYLVRDAHGSALRAFPTPEGRWRLPVSLEDVDPHFIEALIRVEDKRFYSHFGVDYIALVRATTLAIWRGRIDSGASTLTMQMARLLEPRPRKITSKLIEIFRAHQIEARLSKRQILEAYLTLTPYGGNLEGVESASWAWFGKTASTLTDTEIALLLALPQAPEARRPDRKEQIAKKARNKIAEELAKFGIWSQARTQGVLLDHVPTARNAFPNAAWHASARVGTDLTNGRPQNSSLRGDLQKAVSTHLRAKLISKSDTVQAGAILVHTPSNCVLAYVGSLGRDRSGGWLDLMALPRSPGSALKPFIYGIGMDRGLVSPDTLLKDMPADFGGYRPNNFDKKFHGDVSMAEALQYSLNIPAVQILNTFGADNFRARLSFAGIPLSFSRQAESQTGLSLALGAVGISGTDLVRLYAALGTGGQVRPLQWTGSCPNHAEDAGARVLSSDAARKIVDILKNAPAPAGRSPADLTQNAPQVAYKTGTSYGYRDAWAAGLAGELAAVVWIGRPDGAPNGNETGSSSALPILFDLIDIAFANPIFQEGTEQSNRTITDEKNRAQSHLDLVDQTSGPSIIFPPANAELFLSSAHTSRYVFAAQSELAVEWYIDTEKLTLDPLGQAVWTPTKAGFFEVAAVDSEGRRASVDVRVKRFINE